MSTSRRNLDTNVTVSILRYTATLGNIPGRPDLPPFDFRCFEVLIRKHHRGFWVEFKPNYQNRSIDVYLCYHPNIANIRQALGGLTQLIQIEKLDTSISAEEDSLASLLYFAMNPPLSSTASMVSSQSSGAPSSANAPATSASLASTSSLASLLPMSSASTPTATNSIQTLTAAPPVPTSSQKRKKKSAKQENQMKKKTKKNVFNDDLENLITLEQIVQETLDNEFNIL